MLSNGKKLFSLQTLLLVGKKYWALPSGTYDGVSRSWNIAQLLYLKAIQDDKLPNEIETIRSRPV
jgi:hypothetical protein